MTTEGCKTDLKPFAPLELAARWGCSERHVRKLIASGRLQCFKLGGKLMRVPASVVEEFERVADSTSFDVLERAQSLAFGPRQLAERWQCSEKHVRNMVARGELCAFRLNGMLLRVSKQTVEEFERQRHLIRAATKLGE
jgi:excisionase family DNA binding protein